MCREPIAIHALHRRPLDSGGRMGSRHKFGNDLTMGERVTSAVLAIDAAPLSPQFVPARSPSTVKPAFSNTAPAFGVARNSTKAAAAGFCDSAVTATG